MDDIKEILSQNISGFHEYILDGDDAKLGYISENFCRMVGFTSDEISQLGSYSQLVHKGDTEKFFELISGLKSGRQSVSAEYRLVAKDGSVIYVKDCSTLKISENGDLAALSVLTDITDIKRENENLKFLNETIPCGFLKYTCEKQPKITYINDEMKRILGFDKCREGEIDYLELCRQNIFLMVPMEERRRLALYLNRVYSAGTPMAGDITMLKCDGTRARIFGWVTKCVNDDGLDEFQSVCMDITERHMSKKVKETERYIKALSDVYDKIFEYDLSSGTVKCLYSNNSPSFRWLENIPMQMESATEKWISDTVDLDDRDKMLEFFRDFRAKKLYREGERPPQITYSAKSSRGDMRRYTGIFIKMDESVSLYCCRCLSESAETESLRCENLSLKEDMQQLIMRFTDGIAAFEVTDRYVTPLYASDNVCGFFGFTKDEWLPLMQKRTPIEEFVRKSETAYEDFAALLETGEAEFAYLDLATDTERRVKAVCSHKNPRSSSPRYVMLYNVEGSNGEKSSADSAVTVRTFGYFDVFVGEKPIVFRNKKSKELFALLIDRKGGYISSEEAIGFLWEDEAVTPVTLARYRKVALRLKNTLEEYGIADIMESVDGRRRIVPEKLRCDFYDYLSGKEEYSRLFKGSYLSNYSWGEKTLAELTGDM